IVYSLIEDGGCGISDGMNGNRTGNPNLSALQVVGNQGFLLLNQPSPAIDGGNNSLLPPEITEDQSGNQRIFPADGTVDMGSVEFGQVVLTLVEAITTLEEGSSSQFTLSRMGLIDEPLVVHFARGNAIGADDYSLSIAGVPLTEDK